MVPASIDLKGRKFIDRETSFSNTFCKNGNIVGNIKFLEESFVRKLFLNLI